ncbi:hypothetical protein GOBAR_AA26134 [Gossypium barbadense]|uniref:Uncharacterized protein n=1 Tax=Gossypium barbadense TaxID=3634 RepID=A0A2P5WTY2_GOSBA|nr:hypothetical protein GOBAR_AA26134 [Gossypium barbadense]
MAWNYRDMRIPHQLGNLTAQYGQLMGYGAILRHHDGGLLVARCQSNRGSMVTGIILIEGYAFGGIQWQLAMRSGQIDY